VTPRPDDDGDYAAAVARMLAARIEQGLPLTVTDPAALDKAAAIFAAAPTKKN
jgi:hypothetical protein